MPALALCGAIPAWQLVTGSYDFQDEAGGKHNLISKVVNQVYAVLPPIVAAALHLAVIGAVIWWIYRINRKLDIAEQQSKNPPEQGGLLNSSDMISHQSSRTVFSFRS